jgi:hypothetical protein
VSALQWASAAAFASFRTSPENAQVLSPDVTEGESARVCVDACIGPRRWLGMCASCPGRGVQASKGSGERKRAMLENAQVPSRSSSVGKCAF